MTRPQPRLPELGGMTEAGFNRVVAMIGEGDFVTEHQCHGPWGWRFPLGCNGCKEALGRYREWVASLPRTRNKKQRKADAKRTALHESAREQFEAIFPPVHCCVCEKKLELFDDYVKGGGRCCRACYEDQTPLQRLLKFAAEDGTPVSFEIAEAARKGEW